MKATQGTTYRMLNSRLNAVSLQLEELRSIGATGTKLNVASDDPSAVRPVLSVRKQISNFERNMETMSKSLDNMESTDGHLEHVEDIMQRAKEIMTNGVNGVLDDQDRSILADELAQLRQELLDAANGMVNDRYLFAGYEEDTIPFVENPTYDPLTYDANDSSTWPYLYQGDENTTSLEITTGEQIVVNLTGNDLFFGTTTWDTTTSTNNSTEAGRYDLFLELTQAEEALRANDTAAMETSIDDLDGAAEQNRRLRSQLGNRASRVETALDYEEGVLVDLKQTLSRYQDADAIETFNAIVQQETALQAALSVTAKVSQLSILDYL